MESMQHAEAVPGMETMDHSGMNQSGMQHGSNAEMDMTAHNHSDHGGMVADFKKRFYVVLVPAIPILLLSPMIQKFMSVNWQFEGAQYTLFALSTVVFFYGGWPFFKGLVDEVKECSSGI
jgi:Cu2+-exporting ATPase